LIDEQQEIKLVMKKEEESNSWNKYDFEVNVNVY
jgi:hypothetical protein